MAVTPILQIDQVSPSQSAKETTINSGFVAFEQAGNRKLAINMASGNVTLTTSQFTRNLIFKLTNTGPGSLLTLPASTDSRAFFVANLGVEDVTVVRGAFSVLIEAGTAQFVSLQGGELETILTTSASTGGGSPSPVDYGLQLNAASGNVSVSDEDYLSYRLFVVEGHTVARTLDLPSAIENVVVVQNAGTGVVTVTANSASVAVAAGETVQIATTLSGIVRIAGTAPDHGLALDATSGNVSVTAAEFPLHDVYVVSGNSVTRTFTLPNNIEHSFVVYNAGSAALNVVAYSTTIIIPAGESRPLYTTLAAFKAVTDQTGGSGAYSPGLFSGIKTVDMSSGLVTISAPDFDAYNVFLVSASHATEVQRRLYFPTSSSRAFVVANNSIYAITVYADNGNNFPIVIAPGYMELVVQNNVSGAYMTFAGNKRKPGHHLLTFRKEGIVGAAAQVARFIAPSALTVKGSDVGTAYFNLGTPSAATFTLTIAVNGSTVGTIAFASGTPTRTLSTLDFTMAAGDVLTITCQAVADADAADLAISFPIRYVQAY